MYDYMQALQEKFFSDDLYAKQSYFLYLPICNWEHYTNTIPYSVAILSL